ncbi:uncharacterized protein LOC110988368 isoform X1 [Acanthaster planci]|uniref:Uncharacterized protein LOC110988368 isoform X1 n=1 Tax=Acanthaster planci TaxID=133434 RepID=A0A8B7ZQZ5_ACAPL|nr:uncharacterized protein LOC110988368 isoform X1 [Acanthaster planci]
MALFKNTGCLVFNDTAFFDQNCSSQMMADAEEAEIIISAHEKEQVEQHVEEEIVHEVVSPDQSWRNDESGLIHELEHSEEDDDGSHGSARGKDESRSNADMADHAYHASLAEGEDSSLDDPFKDDTGVFCLDTEDEVKQKIATYEKKSGTRFIVLKKERGYTQTVEDNPAPTYSDGVRLTHHNQQSSGAAEPPEEFICKECNVVYKSYKSLWQHKKDNHQDKLSCGYCDYSSSRMYNIKQHRKRRHPNLPDPFDPNLVDLPVFSSVYSDEMRLENTMEDSDEEMGHVGEPVSKLAHFAQNMVTCAVIGDAFSSRSPSETAKSQPGNSQVKEVHQEHSAAAAYPVGLVASQEVPSRTGKQSLVQRSQAQTQSNRSEVQTVHTVNHMATMPVFPRITSVSGGLMTIHPGSVSAPPSQGHSRLQHPSIPRCNREQQVSRISNSQEELDHRTDRSDRVIFSRTTNELGSCQLASSQQKVSPRGDICRASVSCAPSSLRTTSACNHLIPRQEMMPRGTAAGVRDGQNVQNKTSPSLPVRRDSETCKQWDKKHPSQSPGTSVNSRLVGGGQRNNGNGTFSIETRHTAQSSPNSEPSPCPHSDQTRGGQGAPGQAKQKPSPQGARTAHHFTTVGGILDQHRRSVGLTDFRDLLPNFRVRSITERVVQPDGTRYEIQIDGEEINE